MTTSIIESMPFADYLAAPGVHWSTLRHMADSPLAY